MTSLDAPVRTVDGMNPRFATTVVLTVVFLVGLGWFGYLLWSWDVVQTVPGLMGWAAKLVITGKVLKGAVIAALAVVAGATALARRLGRRRPDVTQPAPPVDHPDR
jgi:hypothetical protein